MKIVIEFMQIHDAGMYDLIVYDNGISESMRLKIGIGQPVEQAFREAEQLAVALDCEMLTADQRTCFRKPIINHINKKS